MKRSKTVKDINVKTCLHCNSINPTDHTVCGVCGSEAMAVVPSDYLPKFLRYPQRRLQPIPRFATPRVRFSSDKGGIKVSTLVVILVLFLSCAIFPTAPTNASVLGCPAATHTTYSQVGDVKIVGPAIVQVYFHNGGTLYKSMLPAEVTVTFSGMRGETWTYANNSACRSNLQSEFAKTQGVSLNVVNGQVVTDPAPIQTQQPAAQPATVSFAPPYKAEQRTPGPTNVWSIDVGNDYAVLELIRNAEGHRYSVWLEPGAKIPNLLAGGTIWYWNSNQKNDAWNALQQTIARGDPRLLFDDLMNPVYGFIGTPVVPCPPATDHDLLMGDQTITGPAIVHIWTNMTDRGEKTVPWGQILVKTMVPAGQTWTFVHVGGHIWNYQTVCSSDELQHQYDAVQLPGKTWQELNAAGITK